MQTQRILRRPDVLKMIGLSSATLSRLIRESSFPSPVKLSKQAVGWDLADIEAWIESRKAQRH